MILLQAPLRKLSHFVKIMASNHDFSLLDQVLEAIVKFLDGVRDVWISVHDAKVGFFRDWGPLIDMFTRRYWLRRPLINIEDFDSQLSFALLKLAALLDGN